MLRSCLQLIFRTFSLVFGVLLLLGVCLGYRFSQQGAQAIALSDRAFNEGEFAEAIFRAELAGRYYFPGAVHFKKAEERLLSIARGAEAEGDQRMALRAWRALETLDSQTFYLGRGETRFGNLARESLKRLETQPLQSDIGAAWKRKASNEDHSALKGPQAKP